MIFTMRKKIALIVSACLLLLLLPFDCNCDLFIKSNADSGSKTIKDYSAGDTLLYGLYPQSMVFESALKNLLNDTAGDEAKWTQFNLYADASVSAKMFYCDIAIDDCKFRGVYFSEDINSSENCFYYQKENGFAADTVYWFRYEPICWRVLSPEKGLVFAENILDSCAFSAYVKYAGGEYFGDSECTYLANDYENSSLRQWLCDDFFNTAFSDEKQNAIDFYSADGLEDKIFLLSLAEAKNNAFGFEKNINNECSLRKATGSEYSKLMGLSDNSGEDSLCWWLRTAGSDSSGACYINKDGCGKKKYYDNVFLRYFGVRPAICFDTNALICEDVFIELCLHENTEIINAKKASCAEEGYTGDIYCADCGLLLDEGETVEKTPHNFGEWMTISEPGCEEGGLLIKRCIDCEFADTENTLPLGHNYIEHPAKNPTCTEYGNNAYKTCSRCDYNDFSQINPLGHDWIEDTVLKPATCVEDGSKKIVCSRDGCSAEKSEILPATGHRLNKISAVAPTCLDGGNAEYFTCETCGKSFVDNDCLIETTPSQQIISRTGHDFINHSAKSPSCTQIGWEAYKTCKRCDYTSYTEIAPLGHSNAPAVIENRVEATSENGGSYEKVIYCSVCNTEISRDVVYTEKLPPSELTIKIKTADGGEFVPDDDRLIFGSDIVLTTGDIISQYPDCSVLVTGKNGESLEGSSPVGTGSVVIISTASKKYEFVLCKLGDVNGDGYVTAEDARLTLRAAVGLENCLSGSLEYIACDADKSKNITAADARLILRAAVGLEKSAEW